MARPASRTSVTASGLPGRKVRKHVFDRRGGDPACAQAFGEGGAGGDGAEAAVAAADAHAVLVTGGLDVPDVAGEALRAAVDASVRHDGCADPGRELDEDDVASAERCDCVLGGREQSYVVLDRCRSAHALAKLLRERKAVPS